MCTEEGKDRFNPEVGGCCTGLSEKNEPRPELDPQYCPSASPNHEKSCWSIIVICRSSGTSLILPHTRDKPISFTILDQ